MSLTRAASTRSGRGRFALCILGLGSLLIFLSLSAGVQSAVGTADEVHYTYTGPGSVAFDWRGTATDIRYGATTSYGSTATAHTPSPLPFSSAGPFQEVALTGLTPGATYHYSIGGGPDQTFLTAPTSGFRFDVEADIGDSTSYKNMPPIQAQIAADNPAFVLAAGDLTYGNAHGQPTVDQHFNDVMVWSQHTAYMPAWGNHEWDSPSTDDLRNYKGRFDVPHPQTSPTAPAPGCCGEDWGWFDAGGVRFISYPEPYPGGTWSQWQSSADAVFAAAQADSSIHFIVTFGHRPAYSTGHHPGDATLAGILNTFGDRYSKYVLNLNGHSHDYERFQPIHGVTHITASGGGATLETPWTSTDPRTVFRAMHLEHVRVDVSASSLRIESVCGPSTTNDDITCAQGSVIDSTTIGTGPPPPALDHIVVSPASATISAGGSQAYSAQGFDASNNSLGDVTASTVFSISPNGSCSANTCTATVAGGHIVTGNDSGKTSTASLGVTAGPLDHLALSPASATINSGGSQAYTAQGRDQYDNSLGDVTASTVFSIAPNGSCTGATCTASATGAHTVTGTDSGKTGTASLQVNSTTGGLDHIVVSPASATISAGGSQAYSAQGFDASNNSLGDVTASTVFSISANGSCSANTCTATVAGGHTVTGNDSGKTSTASLSVTAGPLDHLALSPASATIAAGGSQTYTAQGRDRYENSLGDVTSGTAFSIAPNGSCSGSACTASAAGTHTVTGSDAGKSGSASLIVTAGPLDHLVLSPASATINSGGSQTYTAQGRDRYDNSLGDVTAGTTFSIAPDGSCTGASCTASAAGAHTVTGTNGGKTGTASLQVSSTSGGLDHIVISPASATISAGGSQAYSAQGFDASNNSLGDVTASTVFSIAPDGSCSGNVCTASVGGAHTVTGNDSGKTSTAALAVSYVANPGFETDTSGWNPSSGITLARVAGGHTGGWAARLTNTGTSTTSCTLNDSPNWVKTTSPGTYTGSIWVRADTAGSPLKLRFREYSSSGTALGSATNQFTLTTAWQQVTVSYVVNSAGSTLDFNAYISSAVPGTCFYADDAAIVLP